MWCWGVSRGWKYAVDRCCSRVCRDESLMGKRRRTPSRDTSVGGINSFIWHFDFNFLSWSDNIKTELQLSNSSHIYENSHEFWHLLPHCGYIRTAIQFLVKLAYQHSSQQYQSPSSDQVPLQSSHLPVSQKSYSSSSSSPADTHCRIIPSFHQHPRALESAHQL